MSSRSRRGGGDRGRDSGQEGVSVDRKMIETIREATGATEDEIRVMLSECNYDANETTSRLIDNPFSQVQSKKDKKKKREEDRKKEPVTKVVEVRRSASQAGRGRGHDREKGQRGERSERSFDRGSRSHQIGAPAAVVSFEKHGTDAPTAAAGSWDHIITGEPDSTNAPAASSTGGDASTTAPASGGSLQPIAPPSLPGPTQPAAVRSGGLRSMADLFKKPQDAPQPVARPSPMAPPAAVAAAGSQPKSTASDAGEPNGWGPSHTDETENQWLSSSLGASAGGAAQKSHAAQQATPDYASIPLQSAVGSLQHGPVSPGRQSQIEEVSEPSTTGLGGVPVEAPPRQYADSQAQSSWQAKAPAAPGQAVPQQTLGSSILSSLGGGGVASSQGSQTQPELGLGGSAFGGSHAPVIMPHSAQAHGSSDLGGLNFQFGNFGLGSAGPELGAPFGSSGLAAAFEPAPSSSHLSAESQPSAAAAAGETFRPGSYSQPQASLGLASTAAQFQVSQPQQQQQQQQQQQNQRAYSAFNAAQPQRPAAASAPEASSGQISQGLYGSQAYQNYGANHGYSQYQAHSAAPQASHTQTYGFQTPNEQHEQPAASSAQPSAAPAPKRQQPAYDPSGYSAYAQGQGAQRDFPAGGKYAGSTPGHLGAAGAGSGAAASAAVSQAPLPQLSAGYGAGQMGVGGIPPQAYPYGTQQYGSYQPQYNNYGTHPGGGYGGYAGNAQAGYQAAGYGVGSSASYGQGGSKYGRAGYGGQGGSYQQHSGSYGAQAHKQDKEHQTAHLGAHDLYNQQQLQLGAQQHYQSAGLRDPSGFGYQNPTQGYGGYTMNRQFNSPYYGRDQ